MTETTAQPTWTEQMRDSAFATNIPSTWPGAIGGYLGGPLAFRTWSAGDWARFPHNRKLPIWVGGYAGSAEGWQALMAMAALGVTPGCWMALDMEGRTDRTYVEHFGAVLNFAGFGVWVYGQASTVFGNPPLQGYWVADYRGVGPFMASGPAGAEVRATQYADPASGSGGQWDSSTVKPYTLTLTRWWV